MISTEMQSHLESISIDVVYASDLGRKQKIIWDTAARNQQMIYGTIWEGSKMEAGSWEGSEWYIGSIRQWYLMLPAGLEWNWPKSTLWNSKWDESVQDLEGSSIKLADLLENEEDYER